MDFRCVCGKVLSMDVAPGAVVQCPACGQRVQVPGAAPQAPPPAPPPYPYPPPYVPSAPTRTCGQATAALVLGLLGLIFSVLTAIPAIILGAVALSKIKRSQSRLGGSGMAIAGLVLGVVFTVLGVLVAVVAVVPVVPVVEVVGRFSGVSENARIKATYAQVVMFRGAIERYELDMGKYPTTEEGLAALVTKPADEDLAKKWSGPYLDSFSIPKDPWGADYRYTCPGDHNPTSFDLSSAGPDRQDGTEDDIMNWERQD